MLIFEGLEEMRGFSIISEGLIDFARTARAGTSMHESVVVNQDRVGLERRRLICGT